MKKDKKNSAEWKKNESHTAKDLTSGNTFKIMVGFSLPFLLSYFLQTLYGLADLFIVGQFNGVECTTAVSVGSQIMHMVTVIIVGLAMGATVLIGKAIGAGDRKEANRTIGNTVTLFMIFSVTLAILLFLLTNPIIAITSVPEEAQMETTAYLRICFIGIPFITAYNIISSIFRGLGDSKTPMYFVAISCACNIALDYLFIGAFGMGASGAALGTTLSQTISVIIALLVITHRDTGIAIHASDIRPDRRIMEGLLKIGVPVALQDGFIQVSFMIITIIVNRRGLTDAAAVGIVEKLISFIFLVPSTLLSAVSALAAQNIGAGKPERAKETLRYAIMTGIGYGLIMGIFMQFAAELFVGFFTTDAAVIQMGGQYMHSYIWDCLFAGIHFSFSGYFCAMSKSGYSFLHNIISILCVRIPLAWTFSNMFPQTLFPMGFASTLGSVLSVIVCTILYIRASKHQ